MLGARRFAVGIPQGGCRNTTPGDALLDAAAGPGKLETAAGAATLAQKMLDEVARAYPGPIHMVISERPEPVSWRISRPDPPNTPSCTMLPACS